MKANFPRDDFFSDPGLKRETKIRQCLFTSSIKREIRHFHVEVVQCTEKRDARAKLLFCLLSLLFFYRSRCRRQPRRRC